MDDVAELGMEAVQNHDKILNPKDTIADLRGKKRDQEDQHKRRKSERHDGYSRHDQFDGRNERQRYDQRDRRDQRGRDQELPLGGYPRRPGMNRRVSSLDRDRFDRGRRYSDGEVSTDTEAISSSEDDTKVHRMKGKEILTASLATVATLHAGKKVYDSFGATHKRHKAVRQGKMTQEEADKKKYMSRVMETASIGIAALGLKGVYDEWKEVHEKHKEYEGTKEKRERHREKQGKVPRRRRGSRSSSSASRSRERYGAGGGDLSRRQTTAFDGDGRGARYGDWAGDLGRRQTAAYGGDSGGHRYGEWDGYGRPNQYGYGDGNGSASQSQYVDDYGRRRSVPNLRDR